MTCGGYGKVNVYRSVYIMAHRLLFVRCNVLLVFELNGWALESHLHHFSLSGGFLLLFSYSSKAGQDHDVLAHFLGATRQRYLGDTLSFWNQAICSSRLSQKRPLDPLVL